MWYWVILVHHGLMFHSRGNENYCQWLYSCDRQSSPSPSERDYLSLPTLTSSQTVTKGDGYLEYGVGRFEYDPTDWSSDGGTPSEDIHVSDHEYLQCRYKDNY